MDPMEDNRRTKCLSTIRPCTRIMNLLYVYASRSNIPACIGCAIYFAGLYFSMDCRLVFALRRGPADIESMRVHAREAYVYSPPSPLPPDRKYRRSTCGDSFFNLSAVPAFQRCLVEVRDGLQHEARIGSISLVNVILACDTRANSS